MKALVYHGPGDVQIEHKPRPSYIIQKMWFYVSQLLHNGTELHLYHGTVQGMEPGQTLGHEFMGVVEEAGPAVEEV